MTEIQYLPADADPDRIRKTLTEDGAVIVENVLSAAELIQLKSEVMPYVDATDVGRDAVTGFHTTRTGALVARSPACRDIVMNPVILNAAKAFLGPFCETIQLHLTQLIRIKPGQPVQPLHRDRLACGRLSAERDRTPIQHDLGGDGLRKGEWRNPSGARLEHMGT